MNHRYSTNRFKILFVFFSLLITAVNSALCGLLNPISVSAGNYTAGSSSIHTVSFTIANSIDANGQIVIVYPVGYGFALSSDAIVSSTTMAGSLSPSMAGNILTLTRTGGAVESGGKPEVIKIANITNSTNAGNYDITVRTETNGGVLIDSGTFSPFSVTPGSLDHFSISGIPASVFAGASFAITIEAQDAYNNRAISFHNFTVNLSDLTGTINPPVTSTFSSGFLSSFNVTITKTKTINSITAIYLPTGKSGTSSNFVILPTILDHFIIRYISSPITAGTSIPITITAIDTCDNDKIDFTGKVSLSDNTSTLSIQSIGGSTTPNFVGGQWSENVQITRSASNNRITAGNVGSPGAIGVSVSFNVDPAGVDHFTISAIGTQSAGSPFLLTVTAQDVYNNLATSFSGSGRRVNITHNIAGSINPTVSGDFSNGIWKDNISISRTLTGDQIRVTNTSNVLQYGLSNTFDVISSTVDHFSISTISSPQVAGAPFSVTVVAQDINNNTVTAFNSTTNLTDQTGTCNLQQITFNNGTWTDNVWITKSLLDNFLTVTGVGKSSVSNKFDVDAAGVNSFQIFEIGSPQIAGTGFPITITAKDVNGNTVKSFSGTVSISAAGTISPITSGVFTSGVRIVNNVTLSLAQNDATITVSDGAAGHSGTSNKFNVLPGVLTHFHIDPIADQATGLPFVITVTAKDVNDNTVTSFNGAGSTVSIARSVAGGILPIVSGPFAAGIWIGSVQITQTITSDHIRVTRTGGVQTGTSNTFRVSPSAVDHFVISSIGLVQTAGVGFAVTITAQDANNNTVTGYSGTANLKDVTGTGSPQQVNFSAGVWTETVTVNRAGASNSLTVDGSGKSGTSNIFHVQSGPVNGFEIATIASPKIAGTAFQIILTARDRFGNTATGFNGTVQLSDGTGTISPVNSEAFGFGSVTQNVTVTRAQNDVTITADDGVGHSGRSNLFNVISSTVDHFSFETVGDQVAGVPFILNVTAKDRYENTVLSFNGTVDLSDATGTLNPILSTNFVSGRWSSGVTVHKAAVGNRINIIRTSGTETGISTSFNVYAPPGVRVVGFSPSRNTVTVNQMLDWTLSLSVQNLSSSEAVLDSLRLKFWLTGQEQMDYQFFLPATFKRTGTRSLAGGATDTLSVVVDRTGSRSGDVTVEANVFFTDRGTNGTVSHQGKTGIAVQDSARLVIERVRVSQPEISQGQEEDWTVTVVLNNRGGSEIVLDSSWAKTNISFSIGASWNVVRPASLLGGGWMLSGGETDSLFYIIEKSGTGNSGICNVHAAAGGTERNTGRMLSINTLSGKYGVIKVELPSLLQITDVRNMAANTPYVNVNQSFNIRVMLKNAGGDGIHEIQVNLASDGLSSYLDSPTKLIPTLSGGATSYVDFSLQASSTTNPREIFIASIAGYTDNTGSLTPLVEDTTKAVVQNGASLVVERVVPSVLVLIGGQNDPWTVKVPVRNAGQAELVLDLPQAVDISFWVSNIQQTDYAVRPPQWLKKGGLRLKSNSRDTLIYTVTHTGILGGDVEIRARVLGKDRNSGAGISGSNLVNVFVQSDKAFRILSTQVFCYNPTEGGNGFVNVGQSFKVQVIIENGLGQTLKDIQVRLKTNGASIIQEPILSITRLKPSEWGTIQFDVKADKKEKSVEIFNASILRAELENFSILSPIGMALDSTAQITIQTPARVSLSLDLSNPVGHFSTNQEFTITVNLNNLGTSQIDASGTIRVALPQNYLLKSKSDTSSIAFQSPVKWTLITPSEATPNAPIYVTLYRLPRDKNTGNPVIVESSTVSINVITIRSMLSFSGAGIWDPEGARDGVVSCGQRFVLKAFVQSKNVKNIRALLNLPIGFSTADNLEKSVLSQELIWQVTAPSAPTAKQYIELTLTGVDSLQEYVEVKGLPSAVSVTAVSPAILDLDLTVLGPPDVVEDNAVSLGQTFIIGARLIHSGTANVIGSAEVMLDPLPNGYSTIDPLKKIFINGEAIWNIIAPNVKTGEAVSITARLITIPKDENTGIDAVVRQGQDNVPITIEGSWLAVSKIDLPVWVQSVVVPGQQLVKLMTLDLNNRGDEGANRVVVDWIKLNIEDRFGNWISPKSVLSEILISDEQDSNMVFANLTDLPETNPVLIPFTTKVFISTDKNVRLNISGTISELSKEEYFQLDLSSGDYIGAKDSDSINPIPVLNSMEEEMSNLVSEGKKIFKPATEPVLWNYPNPFGGQGKEITKITYYLATNQEVSLKLYTLAGKLVWSFFLPTSDPRTQVGTHTVTWDGKNDQNSTVLNGVYLLFMKTGDGKVEKTKIAVVK